MIGGIAALADARHTTHVIEPTLPRPRKMDYGAVNGRARAHVLPPLDDLADVFPVGNLYMLRRQLVHSYSPFLRETTAAALSGARTTAMGTEAT